MAQKVEVVLTCDLDSQETAAVDTVTFSYNSDAYAFELCQAHLDEFNDTMQRFVDGARRAEKSGRNGRRRAAPEGASPRPTRVAEQRRNREELGAIRQWARGKGFTVNDRGRIPAEVREAFEAANK